MQDMLDFRVFIKIIEIHDPPPPADSSDDSSDPVSDSGGDGLMGFGDLYGVPGLKKDG
jgi:hypothetical protein